MTIRGLAPIAASVLVVAMVSVSVRIVRWNRPPLPQEEIDPQYRQFMQMTVDGRREEALDLGGSLLAALRRDEPANPLLEALEKRLEAAEQVRDLVTSGIRGSQPALLEGIPGMEDLGLPPPASAEPSTLAPLLPSAREVYWTRLQVFSEEPASGSLSAQEVAFCRQYYDLRMQELATVVGHHVVAVDPNSSEDVCYALVLPLLHLQGRDDDWRQAEALLTLFSPAMLDVLSRFSLLQIERPQAAAALAQYRAQAKGEDFSPTSWAVAAADTCTAHHRPDLTERLLSMILTRVTDREATARLRLKIAESYARCEDCEKAARVCESILSDLPDVSVYGRITTLRLGYLAREEQAERVVLESQCALEDSRCEPHWAQILYLRWWALRRMERREEAAQVAEALLERYPENALTAPILLERATDALARSEYSESRRLLTRLVDGFPGSESAKRADDMLNRLKRIGE